MVSGVWGNETGGDVKLVDLHYFLHGVILRGLGFCPKLPREKWKRLIEQGSVRIEGQQEKNPSYELDHYLINNIRIGRGGVAASGVEVLISDDLGDNQERVFYNITGEASVITLPTQYALLYNGILWQDERTYEEKLKKRDEDVIENFRKNFSKFWNEAQRSLNQVFPILCLKTPIPQESIEGDNKKIEWEICALKNRNYETR